MLEELVVPGNIEGKLLDRPEGVATPPRGYYIKHLVVIGGQLVTPDRQPRNLVPLRDPLILSEHVFKSQFVSVAKATAGVRTHWVAYALGSPEEGFVVAQLYGIASEGAQSPFNLKTKSLGKDVPVVGIGTPKLVVVERGESDYLAAAGLAQRVFEETGKTPDYYVTARRIWVNRGQLLGVQFYSGRAPTKPGALPLETESVPVYGMGRGPDTLSAAARIRDARKREAVIRRQHYI